MTEANIRGFSVESSSRRLLLRKRRSLLGTDVWKVSFALSASLAKVGASSSASWASAVSSGLESSSFQRKAAANLDIVLSISDVSSVSATPSPSLVPTIPTLYPTQYGPTTDHANVAGHAGVANNSDNHGGNRQPRNRPPLETSSSGTVGACVGVMVGLLGRFVICRGRRRLVHGPEKVSGKGSADAQAVCANGRGRLCCRSQ